MQTLGNDSLRSLCTVLEQSPHVDELRLTSVDIDDAQCSTLADFLKTDQHLTRLELCSKKITDQGVEALMCALQSNRTLKVLNLSANRITEKAMDGINQWLMTTTLNQLQIYPPSSPKLDNYWVKEQEKIDEKLQTRR